MFERLFEITNRIREKDNKGVLVSKSVKDLLNTEERKQKLRSIKRLCSVTEAVWINHYLYSISKFAELVQELPASEIHHHSEKGGLLDHTLETLHAGLRIAQGYVMPPNAEPEKLASDAERWRFAVFIAILAHDIGKIVTDIEVIKSVKKDEWSEWHAWYGPIPIGAKYKFKFSRSGDRTSRRKMHEKVSMSMVPKFVTEKAAIWMFKDRELVGQFVSTVNNATLGGHVIAEIVRAADKNSTAKNLGAETGAGNDHTTSVPLHQKLIVSLRKLIADRDLKSNKPGAAVWVTETDTWVVSKTTMEAVRAQLVNEGHTGIPVNVVRLFDILQEHELIVPNKDGNSIWWTEINYRPTNWKQKFTLLRFKNETLWPTTNPECFDGCVKTQNSDDEWVVVDGEFEAVGQGGSKISDDIKTSVESDRKSDENKNGENVVKAGEANQQVASQDIPKSMSKDDVIEDPKNVRADKSKEVNDSPKAVKKKVNKKKPNNSKNTSKPGIKEGAGNDAKVGKGGKRPKANSSAMANERILQKNDFINWMIKGIQDKKIRVNESKAEVHVLDGYIALVSPKIFERYLDDNPLIRRKYRSKLNGGAPEFTAIQREIQSLGVNHTGEKGMNIHRLSVVGRRGESELKVYLIERRYLPSMNNFDVNKAMKLVE